MNKPEKLFSDFPAVTREQWKAKAIEDLKGGDFDKRLVWKTDDGFSVMPFYTSEDLEDQGALKNQYKLFAPSRKKWVNYVEIEAQDATKANGLATEMKKFAANGFLFVIKGAATPDFSTLLKGLNPEEDNIAFAMKEASAQFLTDYFSYLKKNKVDLKKVNGFYEADILETLSTEGKEPDFKALAEVVKQAKEVPNFKAVSIRSHAFVNAGANTTQEVAFTLNKLTDYIDQLSSLGLSAEDVVNSTMFHMAIGGDYFFEIAKLRAAQVLLKNVLELYNCDASKITILSSNSTWSKSFYDPNVNLLRNTTEAMSALLGGCDALMCIPHDASYKEPTSFSYRIALNISNLLKEESYFDKVSDPAAGSYYIESLTGNITSYSLNLFKEVEGKGGYTAAFKAGFIQAKINEVKGKKEKEITSRKRVYVGTNKFPDLKERTVMNSSEEKAPQAAFSLLVAQRATKPFEELKNRTLVHFEKTGFIPKIYMACFGDLAMRKARSTFAGEFFGTAGFEIMDDSFFDDALKAAEESAKSDANIVVMCSSDAEYETQAEGFAKKFKSLSKDKMLVLAGYPETVVEQLKQAGVDAFVHVKSNAIEVLSEFQKSMNIK